MGHSLQAVAVLVHAEQLLCRAADHAYS
jgi:hypothetical protein